MSIKTLKLGWKYRRLVWKYRRLLLHRKEIASVALTGIALADSLLRPHRAK